MDEAINFLNVEIGVFLRYLRCFSRIDGVQINKRTVELMQDAISSMKDLSSNARIADNSDRNDVDFLFDLDENQYELQRNILCRTCYEQFPLSKKDFIMHLNGRHSGAKNDSFSWDFLPDTESTVCQNGQMKNTSPNMSDSGLHMSTSFSDHGLTDDSGNASNSNSGKPLRYSDIVRTAAPPLSPAASVVSAEPLKKAVTAKSMVMTLGDLIRTDQCFDAISMEMTNLITSNEQRIQTEAFILETLTQSVNSFDPLLNVQPFGSVIYSICGPNTNYNLFVDTRRSTKSPALLMRTFQQFFIRSGTQRFFGAPVKINSNRVLKPQLKITHKESNIECLLLFDDDISVTESTEIISDFIALKPICRQLIAYVRAWQDVVNGLAVQKGEAAFCFNTYIISVLVIFFMQVQYDAPTADNVQCILDNVNYKSNANLEHGEHNDVVLSLFEFFHFYGSRYEINNHLISTRIGRWQEQKLAGQQKYFTPEQKRLRDGINANPVNWQKCTMFVQDLVSATINITAEVTREEAYNFQGMCQMFSMKWVHAKKNTKSGSPSMEPSIKRTVSQTSLYSHNSTSHPYTITPNGAKVKNKSKPVAIAASKKVATKKHVVKNPAHMIDDAVKNGKIYETIAAEMAKMKSHSDERVRNESRILGLLKQHVKVFDRSLDLIPFGSTTFGIGGSSSNYNILVDTRKSKKAQTIVLDSFEKYLAKTDINIHFDGIAEVPASRVLKQQLRLIHKESEITVLLLADDITVADTQKIIRDYIAIKPICRNLIECILAWRNALNATLMQTGAVAFQFNSYLVSILVIFFMQVSYDIPVVSEIASIRSNAEAMKTAVASFDKDLANFDKILSDFFWFYGHRYQIWNHVISLNIGRWQERRIQDQQKWFLPNQKRLREGISANSANWKNCTMFIEDIFRAGVNAAAEITTKDAYGFQEMCQLFVKKNICQKICPKKEDHE